VRVAVRCQPIISFEIHRLASSIHRILLTTLSLLQTPLEGLGRPFNASRNTHNSLQTKGAGGEGGMRTLGTGISQ